VCEGSRDRRLVFISRALRRNPPVDEESNGEGDVIEKGRRFHGKESSNENEDAAVW